MPRLLSARSCRGLILTSRSEQTGLVRDAAEILVVLAQLVEGMSPIVGSTASACSHKVPLSRQYPACRWAARARRTTAAAIESATGTRERGPQARDEVGGAPDGSQEDADLREVEVAVGAGLAADLDDAEHREQGDQKPEPADAQVGRAAPRARTP